MCTLTYIPNNTGFTVTQNRDESPLRDMPVFPFRDKGKLFPKDPNGSGTWMATDGKQVACVLNGGFEPHVQNPPYKHSRGLLPSIILESSNGEIELETALGLEPFSLFLFSESLVRRYTFTETELYKEDFSPAKVHIFQSAPLYSPSEQDLRKIWFQDWIELHPSPTPNTILDFHLHGGEGSSETNICMYRPGVQTTSITQVAVTAISTEFHYQNILTGESAKEIF